MMQLFRCLRCKTERTWGNGARPEGLKDYMPALQCKRCGESTKHEFVKMEFEPIEEAEVSVH
jgi:DNA-directed RNA polymerase subunit RPC12/RpoP